MAPRHPSSTIRVAAWLAVIIVAGTAACGGSSSSGKTPTSAASEARAAFVSEATTICEQMKRDGQTVTTGAVNAADAAALTGTFAAMASVVDHAVEQLRALPPPAGDEEQVTAVIVNLAATAATARALGEVPQGDDAGLQRALGAVLAAQQASDAAMRAYGLDACVFS